MSDGFRDLPTGPDIALISGSRCWEFSHESFLGSWNFGLGVERMQRRRSNPVRLFRYFCRLGCAEKPERRAHRHERPRKRAAQAGRIAEAERV